MPCSSYSSLSRPLPAKSKVSVVIQPVAFVRGNGIGRGGEETGHMPDILWEGSNEGAIKIHRSRQIIRATFGANMRDLAAAPKATPRPLSAIPLQAPSVARVSSRVQIKHSIPTGVRQWLSEAETLPQCTPLLPPMSHPGRYNSSKPINLDFRPPTLGPKPVLNVLNEAILAADKQVEL